MLPGIFNILVLDKRADTPHHHNRTVAGQHSRELEALVKRRSQLVEMRTAEKNRLAQIHSSQQQSVEDLIRHFNTLIADLDKQIAK